ncbi:hypothetical protein Q672_04500 [Marinobacter sp. EVN1]|nr:hypothetical protein Q672_04500 [Marinobacter sp. EVN1]
MLLHTVARVIVMDRIATALMRFPSKKIKLRN